MRITATVNGELRQADDVWEGESLLYVLRERMGLPGSKNACEQGECGSCTVYLDDVPVCACLVAAGQAEGRDIVTVEGLADGENLHPVQEAFVAAGAVQCGFCTPGLIVAAHDLLRRRPQPRRPGDPRGAGRQPVPVHRLREDPGRGRAGRRSSGRASEDDRSRDLNGCAVVTMDAGARRVRQRVRGHRRQPDHRRWPAAGARAAWPGARRLDARGCLATPGLVNTHHHLYQWATRGLAADATLFDWLTELYPVWARIDAEDRARSRATAALGLAGQDRLHDHDGSPLRLPARAAATCWARRSQAAREVGLRFHPTRGSMDLGASAGGLPPDDVVEDRGRDPGRHRRRRSRSSTTRRLTRCCGSAVAPCSPFSVTGELLAEAAAAGPRAAGSGCTPTSPRPPTRTTYCAERFGCTPVEYLDSLGWLGDDVWLAHAVHLDDAGHRQARRHRHRRGALPVVQRQARRGHLPDPRLLDAGVPVGLGVDGAASNEASSLLAEIRQAALVARAAGGPQAMSRPARRWSWRRSAARGCSAARRRSARWSRASSPTSRCGGWTRLPHAGIADPVAALVLGPPRAAGAAAGQRPDGGGARSAA